MPALILMCLFLLPFLRVLTAAGALDIPFEVISSSFVPVYAQEHSPQHNIMFRPYALSASASFALRVP